jgi:hypothetical protein
MINSNEWNKIHSQIKYVNVIIIKRVGKYLLYLETEKRKWKWNHFPNILHDYFELKLIDYLDRLKAVNYDSHWKYRKERGFWLHQTIK